MITLNHSAIICVSQNMQRLKNIKQLLDDNFGKSYVIEIAESSVEVMDIITTLEDLGVQTSVLLSDDRISDMTGLELIHRVRKRNSNIKSLLMTEDADIDFAQKLVNQNNVYALIKLPLNKSHFLQLVDNASHQYAADVELEKILRRLKLSEEEKVLILESISESIVYVALNGVVKWKNTIAERELFLSDSESVTSTQIINDLCDGCAMEKVFELGSMVSSEFAIGSSYKLARFFPVYDKDHQPFGMVITLLDITERKRALDMNRSLLEMSRYINHGDSMVSMYNKAFALINRHFDVKLMCIAGEDFDSDYVEFYGERSKHLSQEQVEVFIKSVKGILGKNSNEELITMENELGTLVAYPMHEKILMVVVGEEVAINPDGLGFLNIIAEHIKMGIMKIDNFRKMVYQANHDNLTTLFSRSYFVNRLRNHLNNNRLKGQEPGFYSLAVMDLNYFKDVNDNLSHLVGDDVLLEIAQRLRKASREGDVVARIGGDEFAILFQTGNKREIIGLVQRLQNETSKPISMDDIGISVGSSVGIVYDVRGYDSVEKLLGDADQAMYEAKKDKSGIGRFTFYERGIQNRVERHSRIEQLLKTADLVEELSLAYQPIVRLSDMDVVGYEGFVRWTTKDGHRLKTDEVIQVADESGDILRIGNEVMRMAMDSLEVLSKHGDENQFLSINMTSRQLVSDNHIRSIKKTILDKHISGNRLHIDINDRYGESQVKRMARNVSDLRDFGVRIELDDFGNRTADLGTISRIGVDELKIDRETVHNVRFSSEATTMVRSIVSVAKSFGMKVTAEGVEKEEEMKAVKDLGCDYAQGYYFMRPGSLEDAMAYGELKKTEG